MEILPKRSLEKRSNPVIHNFRKKSKGEYRRFRRIFFVKI
jgi:hypothetical protein